MVKTGNVNILFFNKSGGIFQLRFQHCLETSRRIDSGRRRLASVFLPEPEESSQLQKEQGHPPILRLSSRDLSSCFPFHLSPCQLPASPLFSLHTWPSASYSVWSLFQLTSISSHPIMMCRCSSLQGSCMARVAVTPIVAIITRLPFPSPGRWTLSC